MYVYVCMYALDILYAKFEMKFCGNENELREDFCEYANMYELVILILVVCLSFSLSFSLIVCMSVYCGRVESILRVEDEGVDEKKIGIVTDMIESFIG